MNNLKKVAIISLISCIFLFAACSLSKPKLPTETEVLDFVDTQIDKESYTYVSSNVINEDKVEYIFRSNDRGLNFTGVSCIGSSSFLGNTSPVSVVYCTYWEDIFNIHKDYFENSISEYFPDYVSSYNSLRQVRGDTETTIDNLEGTVYTLTIKDKKDIENFYNLYVSLNNYYKAEEGPYHNKLCKIMGLFVKLIDDSGNEVNVYYDNYDDFVMWPLYIDGNPSVSKDDITKSICKALVDKNVHGIFTDEEIEEMVKENDLITIYGQVYLDGKPIKTDNSSIPSYRIDEIEHSYYTYVEYNKDYDKLFIMFDAYDYGKKTYDTCELMFFIYELNIPCTKSIVGYYSAKDPSLDPNSYFTFETNGNIYDVKIANYDETDSEVFITKNNVPLTFDYYSDGKDIFLDIDTFCEMFDIDYEIKNTYEIHFTSKNK